MIHIYVYNYWTVYAAYMTALPVSGARAFTIDHFCRDFKTCAEIS